MKTIKGPAIYLAQFAGRSRRRSTRWTRSAAGRRPWATRACRSRPGTSGCSISSSGRAARTTATRSTATVAPARPGRSPSSAPTCRVSSWRCIRPTTRASTPSRRRRCAAIPRRARNGPCSRCCGAAQASRNLGLDAMVTFSGALAYPYLYPWPPRPKGLIDTAFTELARRWRPILDAFDEAGVDVCYEIHPGRGSARRRLVRALPGQGRQPSALLHQLRPVALRACRRWTICSSSISTTSGSRRSTSRTPSSTRPASRACYGGFEDWVNRAGRFRSPGDGEVDFTGVFSKLTATTTAAGRWSSGSAASRTPSRARASGPSSSRAPHHPGDRAERSTTIAGGARRRGRQPPGARSRPVRRRRRLRLGMVGGGQGALIGAVHRLAARMDDRYELVAGCFASTRRAVARVGGRARRGGGAVPMAAIAEMAERERGRADPIDVVAIVTPNHLHLPVVGGVPGRRLRRDLRQAADHDRGRGGGAGCAGSRRPAGCSCCRTTTPPTRWCARPGAGGLRARWAGSGSSRSSIRRTGWRRRSSSRARSRPNGGPIRRAPARAAPWPTSARMRTTSPASSPGWSCCEVAADVNIHVPGRRHRRQHPRPAAIRRRASPACCGPARWHPATPTRSRLRVYGEKGGLTWAQEDPGVLRLAMLGEAPQLIARGSPGRWPGGRAPDPAAGRLPGRLPRRLRQPVR